MAARNDSMTNTMLPSIPKLLKEDEHDYDAILERLYNLAKAIVEEERRAARQKQEDAEKAKRRAK